MVIRTNSTTNNLKEEIEGMHDELKKLAQVITTQAVQTVRLDNLTSQLTMLQKNLEDLRRGDGWVTRRRNSVDGEYGD